MNVDGILLLGRVAFLAALYLFLLLLALLLRRELRGGTSAQDDRAPGDLLVIEPAQSGYDVSERIPLLRVSSVGRDEGNAVVLEDTFISGEHARLMWNGRGWTVQDLESTNGTYVNGKRIKKSAAVRPGDTLQFGNVKVKLVAV